MGRAGSFDAMLETTRFASPVESATAGPEEGQLELEWPVGDALLDPVDSTAACVDQGPWLCIEHGCEWPVVSCADLAQVCNRVTLGELWDYPPPGMEPWRYVREACPVTCTRCNECPRDDLVCAAELCWAVLDLELYSSTAPVRLWLFMPGQEASPRVTYAEGYDHQLVSKPSSPEQLQDHTQLDATACLVGRCSAAFSECAASERCREEWQRLLKRVINLSRLMTLKLERVADAGVRALLGCYMAQCICVAGPEDTHNHMVRYQDVLDAHERACVLGLGDDLAESVNSRTGQSYVDVRKFGTSDYTDGAHLIGHRVTFLHSRFEGACPTLYSKLRSLIIDADRRSGWRRVHEPTLRPRTIELLEYNVRALTLTYPASREVPPRPSLAILVNNNLASICIPGRYRPTNRGPSRSAGTSTSNPQ